MRHRAFNRRCLLCESLEQRLVLATFTVNSLVDGTPASLRGAITQANALPGPDIVDFDASLANSIAFLDGAPIEITDSVEIDASSLSGDLTIHANGGLGVLAITGSPGMRVTIRDLIFDGAIQDPPMGATFPAQIKSSDSHLTLDRVRIQNTLNPIPYGERTSALIADGDNVEITLVDSVITGNSGGAQLANRNAVILDVHGSSSINLNNVTIDESVSSAKGLKAYIHDDSTMTMVDSTISNSSYGGATIVLYDSSSATIEGNTVAQNEGLYGWSLLLNMSSSATAFFRGNTITDNDARGFGAFLRGDATLFAHGNTIGGNENKTYYYNDGGGVHVSARDNSYVSISDTTITDNVADGSGGGLFANVEDGAKLVLENIAIANNSAAGLGGGAHLELSGNNAVEFRNSTISGNTAAGNGGGLSVTTAGTNPQAALRHLTIANNESGDTGGGIFAPNALDQQIVLAHAIVADNSALTHPDAFATVDAALSSYNLIGDGDGTNLADGILGNQVGTAAMPLNPMLAALGDNGGATLTHALLPGSPAMDAGDPNIADPPAFDQRGIPFIRVAFGRVDLGAFEVQPTTSGDFNDDGEFDCDDIDALVTAIADGSTSAQFDLNGDAAIDIEDVAVWLAQAASSAGFAEPFLFGDANLDGDVDGLDFIIWNENRFTENAAWCAGDFNADGVVDGLDFIIWNEHRFQSIAAIPPEATEPLAKRVMLQTNPSDFPTTDVGLTELIPSSHVSSGGWGRAQRAPSRDARERLNERVDDDLQPKFVQIWDN